MTEPTPETVRVAVGRLREDAKAWSAAATGTQTMGRAAVGLTLTVQDLSFAAEESGLLATYQDLQKRMMTLCNQGFTALSGIANSLAGAADGYEQLEQTNSSNMTGAGQPGPR